MRTSQVLLGAPKVAEPGRRPTLSAATSSSARSLSVWRFEDSVTVFPHPLITHFNAPLYLILSLNSASTRDVLSALPGQCGISRTDHCPAPLPRGIPMLPLLLLATAPFLEMYPVQHYYKKKHIPNNLSTIYRTRKFY